MGRKKNGPTLFEEYYSALYGERWPQLKSALAAPHQVVAFVPPRAKEFSLPSALAGCEQIAPHCFAGIGVFERPQVQDVGGENLKNYYLLDYASYLAAISLVDASQPIQYLDLCAAPGGKSLIIASLMNEGSRLKSNELSQTRRERLRNVLREYLPQGIQERVNVTGHDAGRWCLYEQEAYEAILLDVPCSSERHLLQKPEHLKEWAPGRTKRLASEQWKFLSGAFEVLKPGGKLLYSTCSISPLENDGVVEKLFNKHPNRARLLRPDIGVGEATAFGQMILPDRSSYGPLFISLIEKAPYEAD